MVSETSVVERTDFPLTNVDDGSVQIHRTFAPARHRLLDIALVLMRC